MSVGGVGGAGNLPKAVRFRLLESLPPEMKVTEKIDDIIPQRIHDQNIWRKVAADWHLRIDTRANVEDQVRSEIQRVADFAIDCVYDEEAKAAIKAKADPLERYALIEQWVKTHGREAAAFFNEAVYGPPEQRAIVASPLFARLILDNIDVTKDAESLNAALLFNNAIVVGSEEAVRILLEKGLHPGPTALLMLVSLQNPNREIFRMLLDTGVTESESFMSRDVINPQGLKLVNHKDDLFKELIDKGDREKIEMLLKHGIIASPEVIAYAREKGGEGSELLLKLSIDYTDKEAIKNLIYKRFGNLPKDQLIQLLLKDFASGEFKLFGGVDIEFVKNSPVIQAVYLDIFKEAGQLDQEQAVTFIKMCIDYGAVDLLESFLESRVMGHHQIPITLLEETMKEGKDEIANVLIRSNYVQRPSRERIAQYRLAAEMYPDRPYIQKLVDLFWKPGEEKE